MGNLMGPQEGLGALIGAAPEAVRSPARSVINPVISGLETAGREGIREPLTTLATLGSLSDSDRYPGGTIETLFNPRAWRDSYRIAQSRSFGQSIALMFGTKDILDPEEVNAFAATDAYRVVSGTTDAFIRVFYDFDVLAGKGFNAYRAGAAFGSFEGVVAPEIGGRFARYGISAPHIEHANQIIRDSFARLPTSLQNFLGDEVLQQSDVTRLARNEVSRARVNANRLLAAAGAEADPTRAQVLRATAESQIARVARMEAGEVATDANRLAATALHRDLDNYLAAPARRTMAQRVFNTSRWADVEDWMAGLSRGGVDAVDAVDAVADVETRAGLIRDRLFPEHHTGDIISHFLATATSRSERESLMRLFLGDIGELDKLGEENYALSRRAEDLLRERTVILADPDVSLMRDSRNANRGNVMAGQQSLMDFDSPVTTDIRNYRERLDRIDEEIGGILTDSQRTRRLESAFKSLPTGPSMGTGSTIRNAIKSSTTYQDSAFGRAVRLFTDMRPHHLVDIADSNADSMLARMMREGGWDDSGIAQWRGRFMATDLDGRRAVFDAALQATERKMMREYGLSKDEIDEVLRHATAGREKAQTLIQSSKFDAEGRAQIRFHDDDGTIEYPLRVTELANAVPVTNFRLLRRELDRYARLKYGEDWRSAITKGVEATHVRPIATFGGDALRSIMRVWKPIVLLRPAWTMRVVLMDEQFRQIAKFGVLSVLLGDQSRINGLGAAIRENPVVSRAFALDDMTRARRRGRQIGGLAGVLGGGPAGAAAGAGITGRLFANLAEVERDGVRNMTMNGYRLNGPFGNPGDAAEVFRGLNSASKGMEEFLDVYETRALAGLRSNPYAWKTHHWGESPTANAAYASEWTMLMRRHFAQDPMTRMFLEGQSVDQVYGWLSNTREGRVHGARLPARSQTSADRRHWVEAVRDQVEAYTGGVDEVKRGILALGDKDSAKWRDLLDKIPEDMRAPIHGREMEQIIGRSPIQHAINTFVDTAFEVLGGMATDELSRNPTFHRFYYSEMQRLMAGIEPGRVAERSVRGLETQARRYALRETRNLLYDLAEESEFASMTKLLMPFYPAWQEVLTRWAGLVAENPMVAIYARKIWDSPNRAQMVVHDDQGNEFLQFRLPSAFRGLVNHSFLRSAVDDQGMVRLDKGGFNLVAQGTPGFGPFVQVAVSEVVQERPDLEQAVRFIIPFGPQTGLEALLPPAVKRAISIGAGDDDRSFASARNRILQTRLVDMQLGKRPMVDMDDPVARSAFIEDVNDEARAFASLRLVAGYFMPVAPIFDSPYRPYIDVYRALRNGDMATAATEAEALQPGSRQMIANLSAEYGDDADAIFLDLFGDEYFALTQSFTRSNDGVPPTVPGLEARSQFEDLIEAYPEWGSVIAGQDGGGMAVQFSRAAYDRQLETPLRPGSSDRQRARLSAEEVVTEPETRLGWVRYSRIMDQLEALRVSQGLPNFQVQAAAPLRRAKQLAILGLAQQYPSWFREFSITDRNRWNQTLEGARAIAADPRLQGRPDIQGMAQYLQLRDVIVALLQQRGAQGGASTLTASGNQDIAALWATLTSRLAEQNPAWSDLYYRRFERDPIALQDDLSTLVAEAS